MAADRVSLPPARVRVGDVVRSSHGLGLMAYPCAGPVPVGVQGWLLPDGFLALVLGMAAHRNQATVWHEALVLHGSRVGWVETTRLVSL